MWTNTKLLVLISTMTVILGFGLLWFGMTPETLQIKIFPKPSPSSEIIKTKSTKITVSETEGDSILVTKVIDGDTIEVEGGIRVRLIGIDTPETVDPRRPVQCFGKEASSELKKLLNGKEVFLEKDVSETDKYGRLLRYVYLPLEDNQMLFVNDYMVREGFALVLTYPPDVKYNEQFRQAEREAREEKRGLWGRC